jgi:hypothetical protein
MMLESPVDSNLAKPLVANDSALQEAINAATGFSYGNPPPDEQEWRPILSELSLFCRQGGFRIE